MAKAVKKKVDRPVPFPNNPFRQPESIISRAFELCKKGVTIAELTKFVKSQHGEPTRIVRIMRQGQRWGYRWLVNENKGHIKVIYPAP
jgi:hypothetical protein